MFVPQEKQQNKNYIFESIKKFTTMLDQCGLSLQNFTKSISQNHSKHILNQQKKIYSHAAQQRESRDRQVIVKMPQSKKQIERYMTSLCRQVWSRAFHYYYTGQMSYEQAKIYSSEEVLRGLVKLGQAGLTLDSPDFQMIDKHIKKILDYMLLKYPASSTLSVNRNFYQMVRQVDYLDQLQNDYLYGSNICFKYRQTGCYNDLIMLTLNHIIGLIEQPTNNRTLYQKFELKMERLFEQISDDDFMRVGQEGEGDFQEFDSVDHLTLSPDHIKLRKSFVRFKQKQKQKYKTKVQQYTSYKIGRKLPDSMRMFSDKEIASHRLSIQCPQLLRILTKWCHQLQLKFTTPNYFQHNVQNIKLNNGRSLVLSSNQLKQSLDSLAAQQYALIKAEMAQLKANNYSMQAKLLQRQFQTPQDKVLPRSQQMSANFANDLVENLHAYTLAYLNRLIHGLLAVGMRFTRLPAVGRLDCPSDINLVSFQASDLVRCKCLSKQKQLARLYEQILKVCQTQHMKLVRVKNRLKKGTRDIVVIVRYRGVLCEIQLGLSQTKNQLTQFHNDFNHYLYELNRTAFGPLTQLTNIWKSLDPRFQYYIGKRKKPQFQSIQHRCDQRNLQVYTRPFLCSQCRSHYHHNYYIRSHLKCKKCDYWRCALCQLAEHDCRDLLMGAYKHHELVSKSQRIALDKPLPEYGFCIFLQSQQIKVQPFRKWVQGSRIVLLGIKNRKIYCISDVSTPEQQQLFRKNFVIMSLPQVEGKRHIHIQQQQVTLYLQQQAVMQVFTSGKDKVCLNYQTLDDNRLSVILTSHGSPKGVIKKVELIGNKLRSISVIPELMPQLSSLDVSRNQLNDFTNLDKLSRLQKLSINQNNLSSVPEQVQSLTNLNQLTLCWNQLRSLSINCNKLKKIKVLRLSHNELDKIPEGIREMTDLVQLSAKGNNIKVLPGWLGKLIKLQTLDLQQNAINLVEQGFNNLPKIQVLNLASNKLESIPNIIYALRSLTHLILKQNLLEELGPRVNQLQQLTHLDLSCGKLKMFPSFSLLQKVTVLNLRQNNLSFLPQWEKVSGMLQLLDISNNNLSVLPSCQNLKRLKQLWGGYNQLKQIPQSLCRLDRLQVLHLQHNLIQHIPKLRLQSLRSLDISHNKLICFKGHDLICVIQMDLSHNSIQSFTQNLVPAVKRLDLANNNLSHLNLNSLQRLKYLRAQQNKLTSFPVFHLKNKVRILNIKKNNILQLKQNQISCLNHLFQIDISFNLIKKLPIYLSNMTCIKEQGFEASNNPIQTVENCQWVTEKASKHTKAELSKVIKQAMLSKSQPIISKFISFDLPDHMQQSLPS